MQGNNRIVTTDPELYGYSVWDSSIPEYRDALERPNDELVRDRTAQKLAVEWLRNNPDKWPFLVRAKLTRAWTPFLQPRAGRLLRTVMLFSWGPILLLFLVAVIPTLLRFLRQGHPGWLIHLSILHFVLNSIIFYGNARYRAPVEPLCILLAAALIDGALRRVGGLFPRGLTVRAPLEQPSRSAVS